MPEMASKYKILWFVVDLYHRQRYFFICGCKRTVTNSGAKSSRPAVERREPAALSIPRFPLFARDSTCPFPGRLTPDEARHSPIEEIL
jgi:hypothetical protein